MVNEAGTTTGNNHKSVAFTELEQGVHAALETYSNIHRGSGHNSMVTTQLFEQARDIVLEYLGLSKARYRVVFCTPRRAKILIKQLKPESYQLVSSQDIGLSLGVRALAIERKAFPKGIPFQTGGGTTRLMSRDWVLWADPPGRFEAGTPAIINVIAFAKALLLIKKYGFYIFRDNGIEKLTATDILYHDELENFSGVELLDKLRQTLIGRNNQVPTVKGAMPIINLDNSASTPTFLPVWKTVLQTWQQPDSIRTEIVRETRAVCSAMLGAPLDDYDIYFTSNTTEAVNLVAESLNNELTGENEHIVVNTLLEHSSNELPWRFLPRHSLIRLPVSDEGFIDLNELEKLLAGYNKDRIYGNKRISLVAVSGASNVLGICNDIPEISRIVHLYGARLLVDAAQLAAHRKIDMAGCGMDYLAFSAHKVYAPFGCGVLLARKGILNFNSEEMELIRSSGEENTGGIAALGKSLFLLNRIGMDLVREEERILTERALKGLAKITGLNIYGIKDPDSPEFAHKLGVIVFSLKGTMADRLARELAMRSGIGVRFGCHCAHIIVKHLLHFKPFLERLQALIITLFPKLQLPGLLRVSLGIENSAGEVDTLIRVLGEIAGKDKASGEVQSGSAGAGPAILSNAEVKKQMNDFARAVAGRVYSS